MQALGYIRFRVDGQIYEHENLPQLKKTEKHDIDVVIDRVKVRPDLQQTPGREHRSGPAYRGATTAMAACWRWRWTRGRSNLFSSKFACPVCSYSLPSWSRACSPSTHHGRACPACDGIGQQEVFDPVRGGLPHAQPGQRCHQGWDRRNGYYFAMLESLAKHYALTLRPFESLPAPVQHAILHGSGEEELPSAPLDRCAKGKTTKKHPSKASSPTWPAVTARDRFGGGARRPGARAFAAPSPAPECHGVRLRP